jgi:ABC-type amino acid transport substrate-binding protein
LLLGPVLIVSASSQAASLSDLGGRIVAVNQFDESVLIVQKYPSIVIQLYENKSSALESLKNGEVDGVLMPVLDAKSLLDSLYLGEFKIVTPPLNNKALRLITLKGKNHALIRSFNRGLKKVIKSGVYQQLRQTYELD